MPLAKTAEIQIYYEVHGKLHDKSEPLLLIAGFNCNCLVWYPFIPELAKQNQLILFDNRGSGQSDTMPGPYTMQMLAHDTVSLLDHLGIEKASMVGHSMGGMILQQICLDFPERITKGLLLASCAKVPEKALMQNEIAAFFRKSGMPKEFVLRNYLPWLMSNAFLQDKEKVERLITKMLQDPFPQLPEGYIAQAEALHTFNSEEQLSEISTPLLIAAGDEDILTPLTCSRLMAEKIPQAQLVTLEGQAHFFIEENNALSLSLIKNFINH